MSSDVKSDLFVFELEITVFYRYFWPVNRIYFGEL